MSGISNQSLKSQLLRCAILKLIIQIITYLLKEGDIPKEKKNIEKIFTVFSGGGIIPKESTLL